MKSRPVLFSAPMVRALLAGTKTQTRRIIKGLSADVDQACGMSGKWSFGSGEIKGDPFNFYVEKEMPCPYGQPGDRLWVRETWAPMPAGVLSDGLTGRYIYRADPDVFSHTCESDFEKWRPSIHMPRIASRITLEITGVRVERLQAISEADACAEGVIREFLPPDPDNFHPPGSYGYVPGHLPFPQGRIHVTAKEAYQDLWESINGPGSWDANPWVWCIEFKRVTP